jgi:hypothetical protein
MAVMAGPVPRLSGLDGLPRARWPFPTVRSCCYFGVIPPHGANGSQHLCCSITHETFAAWRSHLLSLNITIESELIQPHGGSSLYFRHPDGRSIEVGTPGLWANEPVDPPVISD